MSTYEGVLESPLAKRINEELDQRGASCLRYAMVQGRARFGYVENDYVYEAGTLADIAHGLGLNIKGDAVNNGKADLISLKRAGVLTGYAGTTISRAVVAGEIKKQEITGNGRRYKLSRVEVEKWATAHKAKGALYGPRVRRKHTNRMKPQQNDGERLGSSHRPEIRGSQDRLTKYLLSLKGSLLEMTREEFIHRAVKQALDKLKA